MTSSIIIASALFDPSLTDDEQNHMLGILDSSINQLSNLRGTINQLVSLFNLIHVECDTGDVEAFLEPLKRCAVRNGRIGYVFRKVYLLPST